MKLYIMRHGPAEDDSASGRDADRALTSSGRERVRAVARLLVEADEAPLHIISSPLVRALQTAEIVAAATKLSERGGNVETRREIEPGGNGLRLVAELVSTSAPPSSRPATLRPEARDGKQPARRRRVMLVGHEPDFSGLVVALAGHPMPAGMAKAMVVGLHLDTREGEPVSPSTLAELRARTRMRFIVEPKAPALERLGL